MGVLSKLPRLEVMKMKRSACKGQKWGLNEDETFCRLVFLKFDGVDLEHWEVNDDNFPKLERLILYDCSRLEEIPSSFEDTQKLKSIKLRRCLLSAVTSAKKIEESQHDYGNTDMVVIEENTICQLLYSDQAEKCLLSIRGGFAFLVISAMTSSDHDLSDNSETGQHENQSSPPSQVMPHPGTVAHTMPSGILPQLGNGNAMAQTAYPYPDPYYRSIFAPYDTQPYPQCFPAQSMVHLQLMGVQQAGVPLPSDAVEEPVFVNAKQYHGILRRRQSCAKAESEKKLHRNRKKMALDSSCNPSWDLEDSTI
nr:nuclear transcription factor Y subunit A-7-like [Ipomoea batatas]